MRTVGLGRRGLAVLIDAIAALCLVGLGFATGLLDGAIFNPDPGWFWSEWWLKHWLDSPAIFVRPVVAWVGLGVAWLVAWELGTGRSLGDRIAGLEIVDADGDTPHPARTGLRAIGLLINAATLGLGWLLCFVAPSRRALHDVLSGTYLVRHT